MSTDTATTTTAAADNSLSFKGSVAESLNARGITASLWHTGGGIYCIEVPVPGTTAFLNFGAEDGVWGCDACEKESGDYLEWSWLANENAALPEPRDVEAAIACVNAGLDAYRAHINP